jgi:hypothetical protein
MKARLITIIAIVGLLMAGVTSTTAGAATGVTKSLNPGPVYEPSYPVTCMGSIYASLPKSVSISAPSVYAAALANGSRSQYVSWAADVYDFTSGTHTTGTFTNWVSASTSVPAKLPGLVATVPQFHRVGVRIHILWWDPVSQRYSGTLDYTVNAYYNMEYSPWLFSTTSC